MYLFKVINLYLYSPLYTLYQLE